jgi:hypothetical protein
LVSLILGLFSLNAAIMRLNPVSETPEMALTF